MRAVSEGTFNGFLEVDISVPEHLREYYSDFPPLFPTEEVPFDVVGQWRNCMKKWSSS